MGAPVSDVKAAADTSAESLLDSFKSIDAAERRRHASVLNYWLSIKGDKDVAPIRDLDPLQISDAGPNSLLLELIGGGEDAEVKHHGAALAEHVGADRLSQAPRPSLLTCVANKLAIVAISRNFLAFEDEFPTANGTSRCWITLLPLSSTGVWVDYVYGLVSVADANAEPAEEAVAEEPVEAEAVPEEVAETAEVEPEAAVDEVQYAAEPEPVAEVEEVVEPVAEVEEVEEVVELVAEVEEVVAEPEPVVDDYEPEPEVERRPGFSKIFEALTGFHGTSIKVEPTLPPVVETAAYEPEPESVDPEPVAEAEPETLAEPEPEILELEDTPEPEPTVETVAEAPAEPVSQSAEGTLQSKLEDVRGLADEARQAKLRSNLALYAGLGAAYDFALDAEEAPEEYLRLVEAKGLKIQLRSPMQPVVKLAFDGMCDDGMIGQLEAVLAWALKNDLPRGTLPERIETAGGIGALLNDQAKAA